MASPRGVTMPEVLVAVTLLALLGVATLPAMARLSSNARVAAAARLLVAHMQGLRARSIATSRSHGMLFERDGQGWYWRDVRDGNGNGLRTAEVRDGTDDVISAPRRLGQATPHVDFALPAGRIPRIPPRRGSIRDSTRPVRLGNTSLLSFSGWRLAIFGLALVLVMRFRPEGLVPSRRMAAELHEVHG